MEDLKDRLSEFEYYKRLIKSGKAGKRNTIVEWKDGTLGVLNQVIGFTPIPEYPYTSIEEIERFTIFIGDKEYEFVACQ